MKALLIIVVLVAGILALASNMPQTPSTDTRSQIAAGPTPTDEPSYPHYLGSPEKNLTAIWGPLNQYGGYGQCPTEPGFDAWKAGYDAATDRLNRIGPRDGCFPQAPPWREWARAYLPPDAVLVGSSRQSPDDVMLHYYSGWLQLRLGDGNITVSGEDSTNYWDDLVGWSNY